MKKSKFISVLMLILLCVFSVQAQSQIEKDLESLKTWMNKKAAQADSLTKAEWPAIKEGFRSRTTNLDRSSGQLSNESEQEYAHLKATYKVMEQKHEEQYGQPLNRQEAVKWEKELAGRTNLRNIKPADLRHVFIYFMEGVRGQRATWSLRDWDYAEHVYLELSNRKQAVLDNLGTSDKIKIAALQVEFNTLRKSRDARDKYENRH